MTLEEALARLDSKVAEGWSSKDHCTFAPNLGIKRFCDMHDCLCEHLKEFGITRRQADKLFYQAIKTKGWRYYPVAYLYWTMVRAYVYVKGRK